MSDRRTTVTRFPRERLMHSVSVIPKTEQTGPCRYRHLQVQRISRGIVPKRTRTSKLRRHQSLNMKFRLVLIPTLVWMLPALAGAKSVPSPDGKFVVEVEGNRSVLQ